MKLGAPSINIAFSVAARSLAMLSARGSVAVIVKDTASLGGHELRSAQQIPDDLSVENQSYIRRAFTGAEERPSRVLVYVLNSGEEEDIDTALTWLGGQTFDWMAGPPDIDADGCGKVKEWLVKQRNMYRIPKAVLPNFDGADSFAIVNFVGDGLKAGNTAYTTGEYCSRIAGLIAGTPYSASVTYAALPELSECASPDPEAEGTAVDAGKLVCIYDGVKVKLSRGVNSLQTLEGVSEDFKKIKYVEVYDRIGFDLRRLIADNYIGKYTNNYDSECILVTAVSSFFQQLAAEGLIQSDWSVAYDVEEKRKYLDAHGVDTRDMSDDDVKAYSAGSSVFIAVRCKILDAIEDVTINVTLY